MSSNQQDTVHDKFQDRWKFHFQGYDDMVAKLRDSSHVVRGDVAINQVNRAIVSQAYIKENYQKGSRIVDAACGNGFLANHLLNEGYDVLGFDVAESAIGQARDLAGKLGHSPDRFTCMDHTYMRDLATASVDCVVALGFIRYLTNDVRHDVYTQVARILKSGGVFLVSNDNALFEMFALNSGTLSFWAELLEEYSEATRLLPGPTREVLAKKYPLPERQYTPHSVSKHIKRHSENPLIFGEVVATYGLELADTYYPDPHLLPPLLEHGVDLAALEDIKAKVCLRRSHGDWRSMFLGFEFLSVLKKR